MCCLFTCCGWMIDLVQRLWTFTMSCCISSAVCCVMLTSSMSGIALGYNYSLAEYIDLKETNVSIFLKRGVFDDEIADDMDWRRSGRMPVAGHIGENNLRTGAAEDETTTLRSGRRLDDSIFDADDQNKYEGSLMKLTAKPIFQNTPRAKVTDDAEMGEIASKYPMGSLDQMKAMQGLVDARRRMGTGGTTASPLATYNVNEHNLPYMPMYVNPQEQVNPMNGRRMMGPGPGMKAPNINPARFAVPDQSIGAGVNWIIPKNPDKFNKMAMPDYFMLSPTYPSPITLPPGIQTPTVPSTPDFPEDALILATRTLATRKPATTMSGIFEKDSAGFNDQFLREGDMPSKNDVIKLPKMIKSSEEEYEDEIKGLPVRKRRNIKSDTLTRNHNNTHEHKFTSISMSNIDFNKIETNATSESVLNISLNNLNATNNNTIDNIVENGVIKSNSSKNNDVQYDIQKSREETVKQIINLGKVVKSDASKTETMSDESTQNISEVKPGKTLLDRIATVTATKKSTLTEETELVSDKKIKIQKRRKSFESKIVSSKYSMSNGAARLFDKEQNTMSNAEILNSISVNLNEAGLLKNPASSTFVKLLQSTLT